VVAGDVREGLRRWALALDVLILLLVVVLVRAWLVPGYRITFTSDVRISLTSWPRIALWLAVLLGLRYWMFRDEPFHARLLSWWRALRSWEPLRAAWGPFIVSRVMVPVVAFLAIVMIGYAVPRATRPLENDFLDLYTRWDGGWYFSIASVGYPTTFNPEGRSSIAFFPGLPLLMRLTGKLLDVNLWVAGAMVVGVAFLCALIYVYRLARLDIGDEEAKASVLFLAFYPFAVCYSVVLTESLFLLAAAAAFFHFRRNQWVAAAAFGCFAGLLRPNGCLLAVPLGIVALGSLLNRDWRRFVTQGVVASFPVLGMLAYALYVKSLVGDPFAWVKAQQAWGRRPNEILNIIHARRELIASTDVMTYVKSFPAEVVEGVAALLVLAMVWPILKRFGLAYAVFVASAILPPLISMGPVSLGRYSAPLFPIFLWLGAVVPPAHRPYWVAVFAAGQALMAALFFTSRPPY
jgi:mannosyltransferase PIG-V